MFPEAFSIAKPKRGVQNMVVFRVFNGRRLWYDQILLIVFTNKKKKVLLIAGTYFTIRTNHS